MINIIRLGSLAPYSDAIKLFKCGACYCEFEASGIDMQYDNNINCYTAKCPCCQKYVHAWNEKR